MPFPCTCKIVDDVHPSLLLFTPAASGRTIPASTLHYLMLSYVFVCVFVVSHPFLRIRRSSTKVASM